MAVGKGSMARASKAAAQKAGIENMTEAANTAAETGAISERSQMPLKVTTKPTTGKTAGKKTIAKKAAPKKETGAAAAVVGAASEQVMREIVYQKSSQVLDRETKVNETFGVGEAMPIYFY